MLRERTGGAGWAIRPRRRSPAISVGLTTLTRRHADIRGARTEFDVPAKSGKQARIQLRDPRVVKDFRTWRGTRIASHPADEPEAAVLAAVDLAADGLHNTRAGARAHYIHPHLLDTVTAGTFDGYLKTTRARKRQLLEPGERALPGFLRVPLAHEYGKT